MKWSLVLLGLSLCNMASAQNIIGLDEVQQLGRLNGKALACSQHDNVARIKAVMVEHSPKTRGMGSIFEESTNEAFMERSTQPEACSDAPLIALQVDALAVRLQEIIAAEKK